MSRPSTDSRTLAAIDKRSNLTRKELIEEYVKPAIPVVLTDAVSKWNAMGKFTPAFFKEKYGHLTKEVKGVTYNMADFVDRMLNASAENPAPYPFSFNVEKSFPELLKEMRPDIVYGKVDRINHPLVPRSMIYGTEIYELFLGGRGSAFPFLHFDALYMNTQITQVYGSKEFFLYGPDQNKYMYPQKNNPKFSSVDVWNPDYTQFPLFREARSVVVTVNEGETLFFPCGWWHTTKIHEPCITLGRAQLNGTNWNRFLKDEYKVWRNHHPVAAPLVYLYGRLLHPFLSFQEFLS
jgi:histone arginine demethylase JMJD6